MKNNRYKRILLWFIGIVTIVLATTSFASAKVPALIKHEVLDLSEFVLFYRIFLALALGAIQGLCQDRWRFGVGVRTYGAVAMGSSLFSVASMHIFLLYNNMYAVTIAAGTVTGIGFLAGAVIVKEGLTIKGLTTAATIWATAAIGIACGFGLYPIAIFGAVVISLFLLLYKRETDVMK